MANFTVNYKNPDMRKILQLLLVLLMGILVMGTISLSAQDTIKAPKKPKMQSDIWSRIDLGGYLGAQFGTVTLIDVSPIASYRVTNNFHAGLGLTYQYYKDTRYTPDYSSSSYGGSIFGRYFVWRDLFAHVEYAPLYVTFYDYYFDGSGNYITRERGNTWVHDFLVGGDTGKGWAIGHLSA